MKIDYLLAQVLLNLQSRFSTSLVEYVKNLKFSNEFPIVSGKLEIPDNESKHFKDCLDDSNMSIIRGGISTDLTRVIKLETDQFQTIDQVKNNLKEYLETHYGASYKTFAVLVRNYNFDERFETAEIYSNRWHLDIDFGSRQLKVFVLLHDVNTDDGPFLYLTRNDTKTNWQQLVDRFSHKSFASTFNFDNQNSLEGAKGEYLAINTSRCAHRASIPKHYRDVRCITFTTI